MRRLNWENDDSGGGSMVAWASHAVGGKYRVSRRAGVDGEWFEVEHLVHSGGSGRYADWWATPVRHQLIARTWRDAIYIAEADNDQRRATKDASPARAAPSSLGDQSK
jgi:hypothetical protein